MRVLIRSSASGSEYWDTEKRNVFVPKGQEPDFEVTENPESMLSKEADLYVGGLPITVGNVTIDTDGIKGERLLTTASSADDEEQDELVPSDDESVVLEEMNVKNCVNMQNEKVLRFQVLYVQKVKFSILLKNLNNALLSV